MKFIDNHNQQWHHVVGEDGPMPCPDPAPYILLSLEQWHAVRGHWPVGLVTAVELNNDLEIEDLVTDLPRFTMIALKFPKWTDGRAYSQAKLLRSRYRFAGEIRATGEVLVDMLPLLARTGFDAVHMRADQSKAAAERALGFFKGHYQGDVDAKQPLFARGEA
ncbi:DUF934 domain-containing protein [Paucibacter sp. B2R-40]|uniref:DUF934 domain-containing protein n=1 Tax=Paucibacter sp. B2R-40 TaxID=2893554 RepID=UPI0021E40652|nr:DUF934 domain-containing protein [Paucibacter sp. B2R-40]MCV2357142.1 DUF934 domain-containing protein [Paucibacter sp. B2R-40]